MNVIDKNGLHKSTLLTPNVLDIFGLKFILERSTYVLKDNYSSTELFNIYEAIQKAYNEPNKKGYVPEDLPQNPVYSTIERHLERQGFDIGFKKVGSNNNTYLLWYNLINLSLYFLITEEMRSMQDTLCLCDENVNPLAATPQKDEIDEKFHDLDVLSQKLFSRLDPFLKIQVQKRGITIIQNTYAGYDTEYEGKDYKKYLNKLISVQLALQTRTIVKLPLYNQYDISYVHPLTSEITTLFRPKVVNLDSDDSEFLPDSFSG